MSSDTRDDDDRLREADDYIVELEQTLTEYEDRIAELEADSARAWSEAGDWQDRCLELARERDEARAEVERLRRALEQYALKANWWGPGEGNTERTSEWLGDDECGWTLAQAALNPAPEPPAPKAK